jgi:hypothetical protein
MGVDVNHRSETRLTILFEGIQQSATHVLSEDYDSDGPEPFLLRFTIIPYSSAIGFLWGRRPRRSFIVIQSEKTNSSKVVSVADFPPPNVSAGYK